MKDEFEACRSKLAENTLPLATRLASAACLVTIDAFKAKEILIRAAASPVEDAEFLAGLGRELARCASLTSHLTEWDFRDMTDAAYDAYWDALPS